jgi:hypothetical protein
MRNMTSVKTEDHKDPAEAQELCNQQHNPTHSAVKNNQAESQPCDHARPLYHDPRIMHDLMLTYHSTASLPYYADLIFLSFSAPSPHCTLTSLTLFSPYLVFSLIVKYHRPCVFPCKAYSVKLYIMNTIHSLEV